MSVHCWRVFALGAAFLLPRALVEAWPTSSVIVPGLQEALQLILILIALRLVRDRQRAWPWWRLTHSSLSSGAGATLCILGLCTTTHYASMWNHWGELAPTIASLFTLGTLLAISSVRQATAGRHRRTSADVLD